MSVLGDLVQLLKFSLSSFVVPGSALACEIQQCSLHTEVIQIHLHLFLLLLIMMYTSFCQQKIILLVVIQINVPNEKIINKYNTYSTVFETVPNVGDIWYTFVNNRHRNRRVLIPYPYRYRIHHQMYITCNTVNRVPRLHYFKKNIQEIEI